MKMKMVGSWICRSEDTSLCVVIQRIRFNAISVCCYDTYDGEKNIVLTPRFKNNMLHFKTVSPSTGIKLGHVFSFQSRNRLVSRLTVSETWISEKKILFTKREKKLRFCGLWKFQEGDATVRVNIGLSTNNDFQINVFDVITGEQLKVSDITYLKGELCFTSFLKSTGQYVEHVFTPLQKRKLYSEITYFESWIRTS